MIFFQFFIYSLQKTVLLFFLLSHCLMFYDYLERKYPDQLNAHLANILYSCVRLFSKFQILYSKYVTSNPYYLNILELIKQKYSNLNNNKNMYEYEDENKNNILYSYANIKNNRIFKGYIITPDLVKADYLIIASYLSIKPTLNKIIDKEYLFQNLELKDFEETDFKFMLVEFKVGHELYKIDLKTDLFTYYLVGNQFNKQFFIFYVNHYILNINQLPLSYFNEYCSLRIIDHDVYDVEIEFTEKDETILLEKTGYKLIKNSNNIGE